MKDLYFYTYYNHNILFNHTIPEMLDLAYMYMKVIPIPKINSIHIIHLLLKGNVTFYLFDDLILNMLVLLHLSDHPVIEQGNHEFNVINYVFEVKIVLSYQCLFNLNA